MRRALILAPGGRDAAVAESLLGAAGMATDICVDLATFLQALGNDTCFAVVTEETLRSADLRGVAAWLGNQPAWSDLPFIVLTQRGGGPERNPDAARLSEVLGNVIFLERPFHPTTFISVARTAGRGRQRQYEARARMDALREGEERLRTALLAGRFGSWELDLASWTLTASAACRALFGFGAEDAFGYDALLARVHPEDRPRMQQAVRHSLESGEEYAIEYRVVRPDGSIRWAELRARHVMDGAGRTLKLVGVSADITERRQAEQELRRLNERLEERVAERTAELSRAHDAVLTEIAQRERTEEQLRQVQKMEMIGQLTGGVAHDFNNLLMAVLGNLDLMRSHVAGDAVAERLLGIAFQGAQRGAALTQRLLAFARRQALQVQPKDLVQLVRGMTGLLERSVGPQIELRLELPARLPPALVDGNQIELALLNLVVNARDAMPDGGALTVRMDLTTVAAGGDLSAGDYVRLIVADTGSGMDAATLQKATEPFFTTKELGKGTGLGLSMVHGLASQLNGVLRLASGPGRGTTAELWLPVTAAAVAPEPTPPAPDPPPMASRSEPPQRTILVVDDDALLAMTTVMMVERLGHKVIEAHSGAKALEVLRRGDAVDLIITDFAMPKMTGAQLAVAARELRPGLPILLATGYAELPAGTDLQLPRLGKPYQREQLSAAIDKLLQPRAAVAA